VTAVSPERPERTHTEVGVFESEQRARAAATALESAGLSADDIGVVEDNPRRAQEVPAPRFPLTVPIGAIVGAVAGFLIASGPASGVLLEARGVVTAVVVIMATVAGGLVGFYAGRYFPQRSGKVYQRPVDRGDVLITVKCAPHERERVRRLLQEAGASTVREEKAADTP
jgi:hypothetical protein